MLAMKEQPCRFTRAALTILLLAWRTQVISQSPTWVAHYGTDDNLNDGFVLTSDESGHVFAAGSIGTTGMDFDGHFVQGTGDVDMCLLELNDQGIAQWALGVGSDCMDLAYETGQHIVYSPMTGMLTVSGNYSNDVTFGPGGANTLTGNCPGQNAYVATYSPDGTCSWARGIHAEGTNVEEVVALASDVVVVGGGGGVNGVFFDGVSPVTLPWGSFMARYSSAGELVMAEHATQSGVIASAARAGTDVVIGGNYRAPGSLFGVPFTTPPGRKCGLLARVTPEAELVWSITLTSDSSVGLSHVTVLPSGKIAALGYYLTNAEFETDTVEAAAGVLARFVALFDPVGDLLWVLNSPVADAPLSYLAAGPDGSVYVQGTMTDSMQLGSLVLVSQTEADMFVVRLDSTGQCKGVLQAGRVLPYSTNGSVLPLSDGLLVSFNYTSDLMLGDTLVPLSAPNGNDLFIARFDSLSGYTGISTMPLEEGGLHIFANPNDGLCTIDLPVRLRWTDDLLLTVFDQMGQMVQRVPLRYTNEGVAVDIRAQAKGVYHVELGDGRQRYTGTIVFE